MTSIKPENTVPKLRMELWFVPYASNPFENTFSIWLNTSDLTITTRNPTIVKCVPENLIPKQDWKSMWKEFTPTNWITNVTSVKNASKIHTIYTLTYKMFMALKQFIVTNVNTLAKVSKRLKLIRPDCIVLTRSSVTNVVKLSPMICQWKLTRKKFMENMNKFNVLLKVVSWYSRTQQQWRNMSTDLTLEWKRSTNVVSVPGCLKRHLQNWLMKRRNI